MWRVPAVVEEIVVGGMWRSPGPSVRVPFLDLGRFCSGIMSPGLRKAVPVAIMGVFVVWKRVNGKGNVGDVRRSFLGNRRLEFDFRGPWLACDFLKT